jgi:hypothetical protein
VTPAATMAILFQLQFFFMNQARHWLRESTALGGASPACPDSRGSERFIDPSSWSSDQRDEVVPAMTAGAARPGGDNRFKNTVQRDGGVGSTFDDAWGLSHR